VRGAGISSATTQVVVADIRHHEGITTAEVRNRVIGAIKNREPQAAQCYESHPRKVHRV